MRAEIDSSQPFQLQDTTPDQVKSDQPQLSQQPLQHLFGIESWYHFYAALHDKNEDKNLPNPPSPLGQRQSAEGKPVDDCFAKQDIESLLDLMTDSRKSIRKSENSHQFFTEDGFAIQFELTDAGRWSGRIKISTHECDSMPQMAAALKHSNLMANRLHLHLRENLVLHQKKLVVASTVIEENYQAQVAAGTGLRCYRTLIYLVFAYSLIAKSLTGILVVILSLGAELNTQNRAPQHNTTTADLFRKTPTWFRTPILLLIRWIHTPTALLLNLITRFAAFSQHRQHFTAFLVTRPIIFGTGHVDDAKRFTLCEYAQRTGAISGVTRLAAKQPLIQTSHWLKACSREIFLSNAHCLDLLPKHQRLQLGANQSNQSDRVNLAKIAITKLVIEMIEYGEDASLPNLKTPIKTLREVNHDWYLLRKYRTRTGQLSAIEIQEIYLHAVEKYLAGNPQNRLSDASNHDNQEAIKTWKRSLEVLKQYSIDGMIDQHATSQIEWLAKRDNLVLTTDSAPASGHPIPVERENCIDPSLGRRHLGATVDTENHPEHLQQERIDLPRRVQNRIAFIRQYYGSSEALEITWNRGSVGDYQARKDFTF